MLLSDRVEALTGPDREVDAVCHLAIGYTQKLPEPPARLPNAPRWHHPDGTATGWVVHPNADYPPRYTASLDAAMMLIPDHIDEWEILRAQRDPRFGQYQARLEMLPAKENGDEMGPQSTMNGATPALALTAAALRSRGL
jgi:hypothetical protein